MNYVKHLEHQNLNVEKGGILHGLWIMLIVFFFGNLHLLLKLTINSMIPKSLNVCVPYVNFALDIIIKVSLILLLFKSFTIKSNSETITTKITLKHYIFAAIAILGFRLLYRHTFYYLVANLESPQWLDSAFEELSLNPLIMILSVVIVAPISEEIVFKGFILNGMTKKYSPVMAVVFSSLLFALMHMNLVQGVNAFLLGLVSGYIYLSTGSIYLSICTHFVNNSLAFIMDSLSQLTVSMNPYLLGGIETTVGAILLFVSLKWYMGNSNTRFIN